MAQRGSKLDNAALGLALAAVVRELGTQRLIAELARFVRSLAAGDDVTLMRYRRGQPPELMFDMSSGPQSAANLALYLKGAYLLDPFYRAFADGAKPGCYRLLDLAPAAFRASEYYRLHFARTGMRDEIGYLMEAAPGIGIHLSIGVRGEQARFTAAQYRRLREFEPLVREIVQRQWAPMETPVARALTSQLDSALKLFGRDFLTEREAEVIQLLLRGHSTKSIAERLRISPETVKLHRKHSYAKLDVCSQAELFHLFIDALGSYQGGDPLTGYLTRR